ncbi:hypothetical protein M407DRAFT_33260, partial [Tulasnella calospora MUT 4182]
PEVKESILQSVGENQDIGQARLQDQFQALFVRSLGRLRNTSPPILLVVDALDECADVNYAVNFVGLLNRFLPSLTVNIKVLLTTRPEAPLLRALEPTPWHTKDLDPMAAVDGDIAKFLQHGFLKIRERHNLEEDWPSPDNLRDIVHMSQGLFQWAHTAINYMMEGSPQDRLQELLDLPSICQGMDNLYLQILSKAFKKAKENPVRGELFRHLLGALVVTPYPISLEIFAYLYADHPTFRNKPLENITRYLRLEVLGDLKSLIHIPDKPTDPIQLMHTSVRDLLVDNTRCGGEPYSVNVTSNHHYLALKCLQLMEHDLKTNVCALNNLSKPNSDAGVQDLVERYVPKGLQYCCRSWPIHLVQSMLEVSEGLAESILAKFKQLSKEKLLAWLEVMTLIGETQASLEVAQRMRLWLQEHLDESEPLLTALWGDMWSTSILPIGDSTVEIIW